jgi:hypothetical protein
VTIPLTTGVDALWWLGPAVRSAAEKVASNWPGVLTDDELTARLSLFLLEEELAVEIEELPDEGRRKRLEQIARLLVSKEVADFEHFSGNSFYHVSQVRSVLESGMLVRNRTMVTTILPDLDEGCRLLVRDYPAYASYIYERYVRGEEVFSGPLNRSVNALTRCMNSIHKNRPGNGDK